MNNTAPQRQREASKAIETIAKEILGLETLETRNSDSLDFSDQAVWTLRTALEAAYIAGLAAATKSADEMPFPASKINLIVSGL